MNGQVIVAIVGLGEMPETAGDCLLPGLLAVSGNSLCPTHVR
jgi:hypothetical protein